METRVTAVLPDPDHPGPFGTAVSWYTPEWAASKGLPLACKRCGLPFDRTGRVRHIPVALQAVLRAEGRADEAINTHCPRYLGRDEIWTCDGKALIPEQQTRDMTGYVAPTAAGPQT